jgi:hypothetical protein
VPAKPYTATQSGDCDDADAARFPTNPEICDGKDNNCNGQVDEGVSTTYFKDADADGWGVAGDSRALCTPTKPYTATQSGDCDDADPARSPSVPETCDGKDNNCNGQTDEGLTKTYFKDVDKDGWGVAGDSQTLCAAAAPYTATQSGDCDDGDAARFPTNPEVCDSKDNNCNGQVDEGVLLTFYKDNDADGYGSTTIVLACTKPPGYSAEAGDCNDFNKDIHPNATEVCNDIDDDCDGVADDGIATVNVYNDLDGDGYGGKNAVAKKHCLVNGKDPPVGFSLSHDDCDDSKDTVYPGAPELCDGILNNCLLSVADAQCPQKCAGEWPVYHGVTSGHVILAQLDSTNAREVVVQGHGIVRALNADGSLKWEAAASVNYSNPIVADMNIDGTLDVVLIESGRFRILNGSTGAVMETFTISGPSGWRTGAVFDLDNDGIQDIVGDAVNTLPIVLRNGSGGAKKTMNLAPPAGSYFDADVPAIADLDGDGIAEIIVGTGYSTCNSPAAPPCLGYILVYDGATGALKFDPTKAFTVPSPSTGYTGGPSPLTADLDLDGDLEVFHYVSGSGNGALAWNLDGTRATPTFPMGSGPTLAPVGTDGKLLANRSLRDAGGAMADVDNDGIYELVSAGGSGLVISKAGTTLSGFPVKVAGSGPVIGDIDADGRLDILYIGSENASVNCYTLGENTFAVNRVLTTGLMDAIGGGIYRTAAYDPFEPNDRATFDPATSTDPIRDSRAFPFRGFMDTYTSSSGWTRTIHGALGRKGDRDYYWIEGSYISLTLQHLVSGASYDDDLYLHMYRKDGTAWKYITTWSSTKTGNDQIDCHYAMPCPDSANAGNKLFVIEVRGKDPAKDFGPWTYRLRSNWGGS